MILVTGGTGFIGRNLIQALVNRGERVRVLLRPSKKSPNFPKGISVEVAVSSFSDQRSLRAALKDIDVIFHLAGAERYGAKGNLNQIDVEGTSNLLMAAKESKVSRIFYVSHLGADRGSAYPVLKAKGIAERWIINSGIPYTIFRSGVIFGEGDQFTVPFARLLKHSPGFIFIPGDGSTLLQPLWVDDLVTCMLLALDDSKMVNRLLSIGGIEVLSYQEVLKLIMRQIGIKRFLVPIMPQLLRLMTLWVDQLFPKFPISIFWLDQLASDRITNLDTIPKEFNLMPSRMKNQIEYLRKTG